MVSVISRTTSLLSNPVDIALPFIIFRICYPVVVYHLGWAMVSCGHKNILDISPSPSRAVILDRPFASFCLFSLPRKVRKISGEAFFTVRCREHANLGELSRRTDLAMTGWQKEQGIRCIFLFLSGLCVIPHFFRLLHTEDLRPNIVFC